MDLNKIMDKVGEKAIAKQFENTVREHLEAEMHKFATRAVKAYVKKHRAAIEKKAATVVRANIKASIDKAVEREAKRITGELIPGDRMVTMTYDR